MAVLPETRSSAFPRAADKPNQGMHGQNAWESERTDSGREGGGQRQRSPSGSHQMQWKSTDATCYTTEIDKWTLQRQRKRFAICPGCRHRSVLWCLTDAAPNHSGLLQLLTSGTGTHQVQCPSKSRAVSHAKHINSKGNIFTCLKPALLYISPLSISSIIITIEKNQNLGPAGFSHKKTGQLVQTAFLPVTYLLNAPDCLM